MTASPKTERREKQTVAASSVGAAVGLTTLKLVVGLWTGSLGLLAEAAHSGLDLVAALLTFWAVRVSSRAPDATHHYGHGKVENLSALAQTVLLFLTCGWILYEAIDRLFFAPKHVEPSLWAFLVVIVSIAVDYSRSRALDRVARKYQSQALEADALHFRTDIWSSLVVLAGLTLVRLNVGGARADAMAALLVALMVIRVTWQLAHRAANVLLDTAPAGLREKIALAVANVPGVCRLLRTRVRGSGKHVFADLHVAVPRHYSLQDSHDVVHRVEQAVRAVAPGADVLVDTEPSAENENVLERIQAVAAREHLAVHHVTAHQTPKGLYIDLDLEVEPSLSFEAAHEMASHIEGALAAEFGNLADINVHIEPRDQQTIFTKELSPEQTRSYSERLAAVCKEFSAIAGIQDVRWQRLEKGVYLSLHVMMDAAHPITEVHQLANQLETRLRRELPELRRILIHTEPVKPGV